MKINIDSETAIDTILKSDKNIDIFATDQYIEAQLGFDWILNVGLQMGPYCNRKCNHCYGDYGPDRKGKAKPKIVSKVLEEIPEAGLIGLSLGDGEPLRHDNKEVMRLISEFSASTTDFPISIQTNAVFAKTLGNADRWFRFLRDNGFDFGENGKLLAISLGEGYDVHHKNYFRAALAMRRAFPEVNLSEHLRFTVLGTDGLEIDGDSINYVYSALYSAFQDKGLPEVKSEEPGKGDLLNIRFDFGDGLSFMTNHPFAAPKGRARSFPQMDDIFPIKTSSIEHLGFSPDMYTTLYINHKGDVAFGLSGMCVKEGRYQGNIMEESLKSIKEKISNDPVYLADKLGGLRFMYHLANKIDDFKIEMRSGCDICDALYSNTQLVGEIRNHLDQEGLVKSYKQYLEEAGLPKKVQEEK